MTIKKHKKRKNRVISIQMYPDLIKELRKHARQEDRVLSSMARILILEALAARNTL